MEKKMEKMKKEIKTQNGFYTIIAALFLIAQCTNAFGLLTSAYTNFCITAIGPKQQRTQG